jgi:hypothetical protein
LSWTIFSAETCKGDVQGEAAPRIIVARRSVSGNFRYSRRIGRSFPSGNAAKKIHVVTHMTFSIGAQLDMHQRALRLGRDEFFFLVLTAPLCFLDLRKALSRLLRYPQAGILLCRLGNST